jgi:hypothetical protein
MVVARLAEYHAADADTVIFSAACAPDRRQAVTRLFAESVLPQLAPLAPLAPVPAEARGGLLGRSARLRADDLDLRGGGPARA